jgi:hypothetical protein
MIQDCYKVFETSLDGWPANTLEFGGQETVTGRTPAVVLGNRVDENDGRTHVPVQLKEDSWFWLEWQQCGRGTVYKAGFVQYHGGWKLIPVSRGGEIDHAVLVFRLTSGDNSGRVKYSGDPTGEFVEVRGQKGVKLARLPGVILAEGRFYYPSAEAGQKLKSDRQLMLKLPRDEWVRVARPDHLGIIDVYYFRWDGLFLNRYSWAERLEKGLVPKGMETVAVL